MSSKRVPLANNPNAANSPFRVPASTKRTRGQALDTKDAENYSPPKKKQLLSVEANGLRRAQHISPNDREGRVFLGKPDNATTNAFNRRLAAVREAKVSHHRTAEKEDKVKTADAEKVKQWRKHYRGAFPSFVFYFESLPADMAAKSTKQIMSLGAREEKFFSRAVTHIVTTRAIPPSPEQDASSGHASVRGTGSQSTQKTINPSLLERGTDALAHALQRGPKYVADIQRARQGGSADILSKARELGMKIWALEKFERMMDTMFGVDGGDEEPTQRKSRAAEHNLQQIMRHEKEKASAAERPLYGDIIPFRGYYIYVHDMDEKLKPVMVREYKTVHEKEDGDWPQFRSVPLPRCPFIEDPQAVKREAREEEKRRRQREAEEEIRRAQRQPRTRAAAATLEAARDGRPVLHESEQASNRTVRQAPTTVPVKTFDPPPVKRTTTSTSLDSMPPRMATAHFTVNARPGLEPMASGLQQANVTSAIRSQMISSTAAAPSVRNIPPKDMHHLQRRAVERRTTLSTTSVPAVEEARAVVHADAGRRTARRKPELARIHEDGEEEECRRTLKEKPVVQRDPKPGYCENCRDKYDDFVEHIESRKHKKFALTTDNWAELDDLLKRLVRR